MPLRAEAPSTAHLEDQARLLIRQTAGTLRWGQEPDLSDLDGLSTADLESIEKEATLISRASAIVLRELARRSGDHRSAEARDFHIPELTTCYRCSEPMYSPGYRGLCGGCLSLVIAQAHP